MKTILNTFQNGLKFLELKRYKQARKAFFIVLEQAPDFDEAMRSIAFTYIKEDNPKMATKFAKQALNLAPNDPFNNYVLSLAWHAWGEEEKSIKFIKKAISINPDEVDFHTHLANIYVEKDKYNLAKTQLEKALELDPNNEMTLKLQSHLDFLFGRNQQAQVLMNRVMKLNPEGEANHLELGKQAFYFGKYKKAEEHFMECLKKEPGDWWIREKYMDSILAQQIIPRWAFIKWRPANLISYGSGIFDILLFVLGGLILKEKNAGEDFYSISNWFILILTIKSMLFWFSKPIRHYFLKRKIWDIKKIDFSGFHFVLNASMQIALLSFLIHIFVQDFLSFGTTIVASVYGLYWFAGSLLIVDPSKIKIWKALLLGMFTIGIINLVLNILKIDNFWYLSDILIVGFLGVPGIMAIWTELEKRFV